jgi:D-mannonate dehydratase
MGHHILGTFTDTAILVYQAFNKQIADYAIREQKYEFLPFLDHTRTTR